MRPIDHKVDTSLCQALACAEYRFPNLGNLKLEAAELAIGLRYSLISLAANAFIVAGCDPLESESLLRQLRFVGTLIREHLDQDALDNKHHRVSLGQSNTAQTVYLQLFDRHCELLALSCPLELGLSILVEEFVTQHGKDIKGKYISWAARGARRSFDIEAQKSLKFALNFYERRKFDLEEVPEIALLGE